MQLKFKELVIGLALLDEPLFINCNNYFMIGNCKP